MALDTSKNERWAHFCRARGWKSPTLIELSVSRLMGRPLRPSLFWPSWMVGLAYGALAALVSMFIGLTWGHQSLRGAMIGAVIIMIFMAGPVAIVHWGQRAKYGLSTWEDF